MAEGLKHFLVTIEVEYADTQQQSSDEAQCQLNLIANDISISLYAVRERQSSNDSIQ